MNATSATNAWFLNNGKRLCTECFLDVGDCECEWRCPLCLARDTPGHRIEGDDVTVCSVCHGRDAATGTDGVFHCVCPPKCEQCGEQQTPGHDCTLVFADDELPF